MLVELHIVQNFAPSNLNRDDTNAPKDCEFGGYRRARISSQSVKRAIRTYFKEAGLLGDAELSVRTKRLVEELSRRLAARGRGPEEAHQVAVTVVNGIPASTDSDDKTEYLLFLGDREVDALAGVCDQHWDALLQVGERSSEAANRREAKKAAKAAVDAVRQHIVGALNGGKAVDLALFGRMIADLPDRNVDAACQVAHCISTHRVNTEFDFYTAVDDLRPEDTQGADMMGTIEFNSACYYRYANVDVDQLISNLDGDEELAKRGLRAFLVAAAQAVPTGKQNSMAAHNPPSLVYTVVRKTSRWPWNLANAFVQPVRPRVDEDLIARSISALIDYASRLKAAYGTDTIAAEHALTLDELGWPDPAPRRAGTLDDLVSNTVNAAFNRGT
ncbi:type I-E CRISPR-associated protein Cas7/Cse4/CasC [Limnochorda pilosa]|uniref:CRISPR-associated protein Cse4 n=1 Tax=Limnochorda pilosa TaxID=1555112 RepID=A0A0K2SJM2_LIMPI|nr:type I-E CRISPR-associated protein Cas7/Cse4/CasC [Limnochorda pilosa]BAS27311.1 CRISPR-associated protein Cse4 [Limnochorda pilosa]